MDSAIRMISTLGLMGAMRSLSPAYEAETGVRSMPISRRRRRCSRDCAPARRPIS
jgi:hypothetical protein